MALGEETIIFVADFTLPYLRTSSRHHGHRRGPEASFARGAQEGRVILESDDRLAALHGNEGSAHRGKRLDDAAVDTAVEDSIGLAVLGADVELCDDFGG